MNIKNKKVTILIISIVAILFLIQILLLPLNQLLTKFKSSTSYIQNYDITQSVHDFKYNFGIPVQISASLLSYSGITLSSFFDSDIKEDMDTINWNPFNENETLVLNSEKVSFYKGVPVFKFSHNRSGSFLAIFISKQQESTNTLRHEFGHNIQQLILGPIKYLLCIGLPSWQEWSNRYYYARPWEITADIFGGVISRKHKNTDIKRGYEYLDTSARFGILSYFFIPGEYNK